MDDTKAHEMLIRIDERTGAMDIRLKTIEATVSGMPCKTQQEKVKTIERVTWASVLGIIALAVKSLWASVIK